MRSASSTPANRHAAYWLIVLPALLMLVLLYFVPLGNVLLTSVTDPRPGLQNYGLLFTSVVTLPIVFSGVTGVGVPPTRDCSRTVTNPVVALLLPWL